MGESDIKPSELLGELPSSLIGDATGKISTESYYVKKSDGFVYYYWRVVGLDSWNVQKTAMKEVPYVELATTPNKDKDK